MNPARRRLASSRGCRDGHAIALMNLETSARPNARRFRIRDRAGITQPDIQVPAARGASPTPRLGAGSARSSHDGADTRRVESFADRKRDDIVLGWLLNVVSLSQVPSQGTGRLGIPSAESTRRHAPILSAANTACK